MSFGGLGIRRALLHAPAAYIGSLNQSGQLVARIIGRVPSTPEHLAPTLDALAEATGRENWLAIEDVDITLRQCHLLKAIDQAVFADLCSAAPDTRSKALALSTAIPHAGDWLNVVPSHALGLHLQYWEFRLFFQYWLGLQMVEEELDVQSARLLWTPTVTIKLDADGMVTEFTVTTLLGMLGFLLPSLQL